MIKPGEMVAGRFEIERSIGSGGMGWVYRAIDRTGGGTVALKILAARGTELEERFQREASTLAEVRHPAVVSYIDHGKLPGGESYLAMEWLEGEDLAQRLPREGLTVHEVLGLAARVADALAALHVRGLVHRDVKPANLFLVDREVERVKLLDFGVVHAAPRGGRLTRSGDMLGTPAYMAPEQARGELAVAPSADVFALGCVLWECLVGRPLFGARNVLAVMARVVFAEAPPVREARPELSPALDRLLAAMLTKDPAERMQSGGEVSAALARLELEVSAGGAPAAAPPVGLTARERRLVSVVLAAPSLTRQREAAAKVTMRRRPGSAAPPIGPDDLTQVTAGSEPVRALWSAAERTGARIEVLRDGSVAAMLVATGWAGDLAVRAARCALAMRDALPDASMALSTCRAVVGSRLPLGEVIDAAASLLRPEARGAGALPVRIDEITAGFLGRRFEVAGDDLGLALRGERPEADDEGRLLGKPTPCVGRERELAALDATFLECVAEPVARVVLLSGPAGIGKSRLRHELLRAVRARGAPVEVWAGHGDPMSSGSPFGLLSGMLRDAAGLREGEPPAARAARLRARVSRHVPEDQVGRVSDFLGELIGATPPAARRDSLAFADQLRRAFEDLVRHEARAQPLILVLEDVHWGDLPTVRFIDAALRAAHDLPLLVVASARPEVHDLFPNLWAERGLQELRLGELSARASERLVRAVLGDPSPEVVARVVEQAAGNPLYLEEAIRAVADGRTELPATVLAMVQTRVEQLPGEARRLLRAASVFGRVFWRGGLAALCGLPAAELADPIELLIEREVVRRRAESRFPGEEELSFRHATVRDAAHAMLTEGDRALGHRLAAEWLEQKGETDALVLAEHLERGGQTARAAGLYRRAAAQALEGNDLDVAVACAERGANVDGGDERAALLLIEAEAHGWRGAQILRGRAASAAQALLAPGSAAWHQAVADVAAVALARVEPARLLAACGQLLAVTAAPGDEVARAVALARAAAAAFGAGELDAGDRLLAAAAPDAAADAASGGWPHRARAARARLVGAAEETLHEAELSAQGFVFVGNLRAACLDWTAVGLALGELGQIDDGAQILGDMLVDAERLGVPSIAAEARLGLAQVRLRAGQHEAARGLAEAAAADHARQGGARAEGLARRLAAQAWLALGDAARAESQARAAVALAGEPELPAARAVLGQVLGAAGRSELEAAWAGRALAPADEPLLALALGTPEAIAEAAANLRARAARIADAKLRAGFEGLPEHARLLGIRS